MSHQRKYRHLFSFSATLSSGLFSVSGIWTTLAEGYSCTYIVRLDSWQHWVGHLVRHWLLLHWLRLHWCATIGVMVSKCLLLHNLLQGAVIALVYRLVDATRCKACCSSRGTLAALIRTTHHSQTLVERVFHHRLHRSHLTRSNRCSSMREERLVDFEEGALVVYEKI